MVVSVRYPSSPDPVDLSGFTDGLAGIGKRLGERRDEKEAAELFMKGLMGGQQQQPPMSLAALAPQAAPEQIQRSTHPSLAKPSLRVQQAHSGEESPFLGAEVKQDRLPQTGDVFGRFIRTVRAGGVTNPNALAAIASTGKRESGFQPENAFGSWSDPSQSGQPGEAGGIMSWRGPRLQSLRQFAQQIGDDPSAPSPEAQAQFLLQEDPSLIQKLQAAQSPEDAQSLMNAAWRYAGHDQPGGETAARMETARSYAGQFGGQQQVPGQGQLESMAVGGSTPMPQGQPQAAPSQGGPSMPDTATMKAMFANPITRPLAINLAQSRIAAMQDQNDPMKRVAYEKALLEIDALRRGDTKPTDDMREFEFARQQGFGGSFVDFQLAQKKAGATSITTSVGEGDKFYENLDKKNAETFSALSDAGQQGRSKMGQIDALENLLNSAPSGATAMFKQFAGEYGINTEGLDDIQAAEALINQMVPTQRLPGSGTMSDADLALFKRSLPRLINQPGGNKTIIETIRGITEYEIQAGEIADAVADRAITPVEGRKALRALQNPLARFKGTPDGANGSRQGSGAVPGAGSSTGRQRARNPKTGAEMEWDGRQWSPVR